MNDDEIFVDYSGWAGCEKLINLPKERLLEILVPLMLKAGEIYNYKLNMANGRKYSIKHQERMAKEQFEIISKLTYLFDQFWSD